MAAYANRAKGESKMRRATLLLFVLSALGAWSSTAGAEPYWYAYEGDDLPENQGWTRNWGNWSGSHQGDGAIRTVENGILTMDSLFDAGVYDYAFMERPNQMDPDPGETFVMEWRLKVDAVAGVWTDPGVSLGSDTAGRVGFGFYYDHLDSSFETNVSASFTPGIFHEYRFLSHDMLSYQLFIDGELAIEGEFWQGLTESYIAWGDGVQGTASRSHWDYFRFGVVPEPGALTCFIIMSMVILQRDGKRS